MPIFSRSGGLALCWCQQCEAGAWCWHWLHPRAWPIRIPNPWTAWMAARARIADLRHAGDATLARHHRAVAEHAAVLEHDARHQREERRPRRAGVGRHEDLARAHLARLLRQRRDHAARACEKRSFWDLTRISGPLSPCRGAQAALKSALTAAIE